MARGVAAQPTFSLKDQLFNAGTLGQLGREYAAGIPGFDGDAFAAEALAGVPDRSLIACLDHFADCLEPRLAPDFPTMGDQLEAAMPPRLDPSLTDDDFGLFIHAVPGVLAVRHGLEHHRDRALDLLHAATQRFSMEFYIRPFLNRWPEETLTRLALWAEDDNYHVRRLVSEGTRPKLPWAKNITMDPARAWPLLDRLHVDPTRFVTRSVANHLNDITKTDTPSVVARLRAWAKAGAQRPKELDWMTRHALRTAVKAGDADALALLGYARDVLVQASLTLDPPDPQIGQAVTIRVTLEADQDLPVMVDYRLRFARPSGRAAERVFKLKQAKLKAGVPLTAQKAHKLRGDATTFTLHPGAHGVTVQVNGVDVASGTFDLR
ncbi:MAG: DNA alkylation repair protein [Pseudomonadota bacterium]